MLEWRRVLVAARRSHGFFSPERPDLPSEPRVAAFVRDTCIGRKRVVQLELRTDRPSRARSKRTRALLCPPQLADGVNPRGRGQSLMRRKLTFADKLVHRFDQSRLSLAQHLLSWRTSRPVRPGSFPLPRPKPVTQSKLEPERAFALLTLDSLIQLTPPPGASPTVVSRRRPVGLLVMSPHRPGRHRLRLGAPFFRFRRPGR
jgi:hypothetical protein